MNGVYFGILLLGVTVCARSVDEWPVVSLDNENVASFDIDDPDTESQDMPTKEDHEVHVGCTYKYAFMAYLSTSMSVGAKQHIKFDRVTVNYGNGYTSYVGTYRAPVTGLYHFSFSVGSDRHSYARVNLMHNSNVVVGAVAYGYGAWQQGSNTAIVRMKAGDHAWIETEVAGYIFATNGNSRFTTFSGFYLYN